MSDSCTISNLAQPFAPVKTQLNSQLPLFPEPVIHHKIHLHRGTYIVLRKGIPFSPPYGVSTRSKVLPVSLFTKKHSQVERCLETAVGLSHAETEAAMRLLRLQVYYGRVYPKADDVANGFQDFFPTPFFPPGPLPVYHRHNWGCSKASFWRAVRRLKDLGLVTVVNRYVLRPKAQISNLYHLDRLLLVIARYLAEHGCPFTQKWLKPYLSMPGSVFWRSIFTPGAIGGTAGDAVPSLAW